MDAPRPEAAQVAELRHQMGLTQAAFGSLVYATERAVQAWEAGERRMPALEWEIVGLLRMWPGMARMRKRWRRRPELGGGAPDP